MQAARQAFYLLPPPSLPSATTSIALLRHPSTHPPGNNTTTRCTPPPHHARYRLGRRPAPTQQGVPQAAARSAPGGPCSPSGRSSMRWVLWTTGGAESRDEASGKAHSMHRRRRPCKNHAAASTCCPGLVIALPRVQGKEMHGLLWIADACARLHVCIQWGTCVFGGAGRGGRGGMGAHGCPSSCSGACEPGMCAWLGVLGCAGGTCMALHMLWGFP